MRDWCILSICCTILSACAETGMPAPQRALYPSAESDFSLSPELDEELTNNSNELNSNRPKDIQPADPKWIRGAPIQFQLDATSEEPFWIGLWVELPNTEPEKTRPPMALSLVVDTSGSMAGTKIEHARLAAKSFLGGLSQGDIISIYGFSDAVTEIAKPTIVNSSTRFDLIQRSDRLQAMGATNLFDGLQVGQSRAGSAPDSHSIRRVVVISDGKANVGPLSPKALGDLAAYGTEAGVQVSAVGIGLDYDEQILGALAIRSAGRLYHLEEPSEMSGILNEELQLLSRTAAANAFLEIEPQEGIEFLGAEFVDAQKSNGTLRIALGTLYSGQQREILVRAKTSIKTPGPLALGKARLIYRIAGEKAASWQSQGISLSASLTSDRIAAKASENAEVKVMLARHEAALAELRAAEMLNHGRTAEAVKEFESAEKQLQAAAGIASSPTRRNQLKAQAERVSKSRADAAKVTTKPQARARALRSYSYAFDSAGY